MDDFVTMSVEEYRRLQDAADSAHRSIDKLQERWTRMSQELKRVTRQRNQLARERQREDQRIEVYHSALVKIAQLGPTSSYGRANVVLWARKALQQAGQWGDDLRLDEIDAMSDQDQHLALADQWAREIDRLRETMHERYQQGQIQGYREAARMFDRIANRSPEPLAGIASWAARKVARISGVPLERLLDLDRPLSELTPAGQKRAREPGRTGDATCDQQESTCRARDDLVRIQVPVDQVEIGDVLPDFLGLSVASIERGGVGPYSIRFTGPDSTGRTSFSTCWFYPSDTIQVEREGSEGNNETQPEESAPQDERAVAEPRRYIAMDRHPNPPCERCGQGLSRHVLPDADRGRGMAPRCPDEGVTT